LLFAVLVTSACGGSTTQPSGGAALAIQEMHANLTTPDEGVELTFSWGQAMTSPLNATQGNVALFTFPSDPADPKAAIERIVVNQIHSHSACPADFQITLISPAGNRFIIWNREGPCNVATINEDAGNSVAVTTFVTNRELSGVAGEPLCMHCTDPVGSSNPSRPDDHWKWQFTSSGLSKAVGVSASHPPAPVTGGAADLGMTVTFYYKALFKG
jgi:hypothetical protein